MNTRRIRWIVVLALALLLSAAPLAVATPGDLDPSFDGDGMVTTVFGVYSRAYDMELDSDGHIILGGKTEGKLALARFNGDGSLDTTLDGDGKLITDQVAGWLGLVPGVAVDQLDRITIGNTDFSYLGRYLPDGSLDIVFAQPTSLLGSYCEARDVAVDDGGNIVMVGTCGSTWPYYAAIVRWLANGALDTGFDGDGVASRPGGAKAVAIDAVGRILVASGWTVTRFNMDGSWDTTFGLGGNTPIDIEGGDALALAIDGSGRIVVAGYWEDAYPNDVEDFAVARLTPDGSLDTTFGGGDGKVITDFGGTEDIGYAVTVDSLDRVIVAGETNANPGGTALTRYNVDGSLDLTFGGGDGMVITEGVGVGMAVAVDSSGRIVGAGASCPFLCDFAVARYLVDEPLPPPTTIDIKPGEPDNVIPYKSRGKTQVAILSSETFDAPSQVIPLTLTFGRTGDEKSLSIHKKGTAQCNVWDVNADGLIDLVCAFLTEYAGFQPGDSEGVLKGETVDGVFFEARDSVRVVPK